MISSLGWFGDTHTRAHTHTHTVTMVTADTPWVTNLSEIQPCRAAGAPPLQCSQTNQRCFNSEVIKRYSLHAARVVFPQQQQVTVKLVILLDELDVCIPSPSARPTAHYSRDWMFPYCGEKYQKWQADKKNKKYWKWSLTCLADAFLRTIKVSMNCKDSIDSITALAVVASP